MKGWTGKLVPRTLEIHQKNMLFFWTMFKGCWQTFPCFRGRNLSFGAVSWIKCSCHSRILDTKKLDTKISIEFLHLVARNFLWRFFSNLRGLATSQHFSSRNGPNQKMARQPGRSLGSWHGSLGAWCLSGAGSSTWIWGDGEMDDCRNEDVRLNSLGEA